MSSVAGTVALKGQRAKTSLLHTVLLLLFLSPKSKCGPASCWVQLAAMPVTGFARY